MGSYPTGAPHDPEIYISGLASLFAEYREEAVRAICDPRSGIATKIEWLPKFKEVKDWLDDWERFDRAKAAEPPKAIPLKPIPRKRNLANLFVPSDVPHYEAMMARHTAEGEKYGTRTERRTCSDGRVAFGVWVPAHWYQDMELGQAVLKSGIGDFGG